MMHTFKIQPLVALARNGFAGHFRRNLGISAIVVQKATDPIQKLFADKVKEYAQKSKSASGKLVDASPEILKAQKEDLERIEKQFGAGPGVDLLSFPQLSFKDPAIDPIDLESKK